MRIKVKSKLPANNGLKEEDGSQIKKPKIGYYRNKAAGIRIK